MATNDFDAVAAVLADNFVLDRPQSKERIRGADNFAGLNAAYPAEGPWVFTVNRIGAAGHEVVSDVSTTDGAVTDVMTGKKIAHISARNRRASFEWPRCQQRGSSTRARP